MLIQVFDKKGEAFEVRPDKARNLVVSEGWSMEPPKATPLAIAAPEAKDIPHGDAPYTETAHDELEAHLHAEEHTQT